MLQSDTPAPVEAHLVEDSLAVWTGGRDLVKGEDDALGILHWIRTTPSVLGFPIRRRALVTNLADEPFRQAEDASLNVERKCLNDPGQELVQGSRFDIQ